MWAKKSGLLNPEDEARKSEVLDTEDEDTPIIQAVGNILSVHTT